MKRTFASLVCLTVVLGACNTRTETSSVEVAATRLSPTPIEAQGNPTSSPVSTSMTDEKTPFLHIMSVYRGDQIELIGLTSERELVRLGDATLSTQPILYSPATGDVVYGTGDQDSTTEIHAYNIRTAVDRTLSDDYSPTYRDLALSRDGRFVAFTMRDPNSSKDRHDVRAINTDTGSLAWTLENAFSPAWSPTDDRIAFVDYSPEGNHRSVLIRNLDGTVTNVTRNLQVDPYALTWSSVSSELFFLAEEPTTGLTSLYLVSAQTGETKRVTDGVKVYAPIVVSQDTASLAFVSSPSEGNRVYTLTLNDLTLRSFDTPLGIYLNPTWSSNGKQISVSVFTQDEQLAPGLAVIDVSTGEIGQVVASEPDQTILWSIWLP